MIASQTVSVEIPIVSIKGSVILPRAFMKIIFVNEKYRKVADYIMGTTHSHFLFACVQKEDESKLLSGESVIGSICKMLDLKKTKHDWTGFVLGISPAKITYDHSEDLVDFAEIDLIQEVNDLSDEEYRVAKRQLLDLFEEFQHALNFKTCSARPLKDLQLEDLIGQFGSYGPMTIEFKKKLLQTSSLREKTDLMIGFLADLVTQSIPITATISSNQN